MLAHQSHLVREHKEQLSLVTTVYFLIFMFLFIYLFIFFFDGSHFQIQPLMNLMNVFV